MRAQITLTPTESKKLIAKAVAKMEVVQRAAQEGVIAIHPSSSTYFIVEELLGERANTTAWACGIVVPKATCIEMGSRVSKDAGDVFDEKGRGGPEDFRLTWVIKDGTLRTGIKLGTLLGEMGPQDVYIKGVNALDMEGTVGVLIGNPVEGGTIARVVAASRRKGFPLIFPVGLEKLVPHPIREASKEAQRRNLDYCTGMACNLMPVAGAVVTEITAFDILSGAKATVIAAGGLSGAEGAVTLVLTGGEEQVSPAITFFEASKGAVLPQVRTFNCYDCPIAHCHSPIVGKSWA